MFIIGPPGSVDKSPGSFHDILAHFLLTGFVAWVLAVIYGSLTDAQALSETFFWCSFVVIGLFVPYVNSIIIASGTLFFCAYVLTIFF
jgi:hypothetical protein